MNISPWKVIFIFFLTSSITFSEVPEKITVALNIKPSFPNRGVKGTENSHYPGVAFETLKLIEKEIKHLAIPLETKPYYLLISHQFYNKYPELSETIWNVISELRIQTFEWQMIKDKYYKLDHWQEGGFE